MNRLTPMQALQFVIKNRFSWKELMGSPKKMNPTLQEIVSVKGNRNMLLKAKIYKEQPGRRTPHHDQLFKDAWQVLMSAKYGHGADKDNTVILASIAKGAAKMTVTKDHLEGKVEMTPDQQSWVKSTGRGMVWSALAMNG